MQTATCSIAEYNCARVRQHYRSMLYATMAVSTDSTVSSSSSYSNYTPQHEVRPTLEKEKDRLLEPPQNVFDRASFRPVASRTEKLFLPSAFFFSTYYYCVPSQRGQALEEEQLGREQASESETKSLKMANLLVTKSLFRSVP